MSPRAAQRPPVSIRYPSAETETEARTRAARLGVSLNAYVVNRTSRGSSLTTRMIATPFILGQLRELRAYTAAGNAQAATERIDALLASIG